MNLFSLSLRIVLVLISVSVYYILLREWVWLKRRSTWWNEVLCRHTGWLVEVLVRHAVWLVEVLDRHTGWLVKVLDRHTVWLVEVLGGNWLLIIRVSSELLGWVLLLIHQRLLELFIFLMFLAHFFSCFVTFFQAATATDDDTNHTGSNEQKNYKKKATNTVLYILKIFSVLVTIVIPVIIIPVTIQIMIPIIIPAIFPVIPTVYALSQEKSGKTALKIFHTNL